MKRTRLRSVGRKAARDRVAVRAFRQAVMERAEGLCEVRDARFCTTVVHRADHAHHVLMRSQGGENCVDNGLAVCMGAHIHIHAQPLLSYELGFLRRRSDANGNLGAET